MENKKKILILAPHQDDEIILCGGFLQGLIENGYYVNVVFMTNGDYTKDIGKIRLEEALEVLSDFGLQKEQIIFMGYANEYDINGPHIYNANKNQEVKSQIGKNETYGLKEHPEYCFQKYGIHHKYCRNNLINDLYEILLEIKPEIIFATDAEVHPDHKANSLFLDEVLGKILQSEKGYAPIVLKKPEYSTSWFNFIDYSQKNNKASMLSFKAKVNEETSDFNNPYMRWNERIRLPIDLSVQNPIKKENSLWKALKGYKSQNAVSHYERMLNSDVTFWTRRTDSLTYHSSIETSSGNGSFLNDFKLFDSDDIKRKKYDLWQIGASVWHPEIWDTHPFIKINWKEKRKISEIVFYQDFCPKSEILKSHIVFDNGQIISIGKFELRKPTMIYLDSVFASGFTFFIDKCSNMLNAPGISEIEVYEQKIVSYVYIKLLIDENFVYRFIANNNKDKKRLSIYLIDNLGLSHYAKLKDVNILITDLYGKIIKTENYINKYGKIYKKLEENIRIQISLKSQPELKDTVLIFKNSKKEKEYWNFVSLTKKVKIPYKDINKMIISMGFEKLQYIQKFYRVAYIKGHIKLCLELRIFYLHYFLGCLKRRLLTDYQYYEGITFLLLNESTPDCHQYIKAYIQGKRKKVKSINEKKIFFIGTPSHYNLGDHVISFTTKKYLEKIFPNVPIIEISIHEFPYMLGILEKIVTKDDLIILQGGGNMGNIYWSNERVRREILKRFIKNYIFIFPETIDYEDTVYGNVEMTESINIYRSAKQLTICAREKVSYKIMQKLYPNANVILTPDIVCSYKFKKTNTHNNIAKLFIRHDRESCINIQMKEIIEKTLFNLDQKYVFSDMIYQSKGYIGKSNRDYIIMNKIKEISESKFIITDRLHVMILSVLTETPCIVFCGYNHKIESTYKTWFNEVPYIVLIKDVIQLSDSINKVLNAKGQVYVKKWEEDFKTLKYALREAWI